MAKLGISFVIPCYNEEGNILQCIHAIEEDANSIWGLEYDIIVVDNNSTDKTSAIAHAAGVKVVHEPKKGVVHARQAGYKESKYKYIANIDADTQIPKGWVKAALHELEPNGKIQAVTGPLRFYDAGRIVNSISRIFYTLARLSHNTLGHSIQGGNCMIRRSAIDAIGGYDTKFEFYGEDTRTAKLIQTHFGMGSIKMVPEMWQWTSARRLKNQGYLNTTWTYVINYVSTTLRNKPVTTTYKDYR